MQVKNVSPTILEYLTTIVQKENILLNENMDKHTSFRIGGPVEAFIKAQSVEQVKTLVSYFYKAGREYFILGNGSNLLVGDKGYKGIVLQIGPAMGNVTIEECLVTVEAGALLTKVSKEAAAHGLTGLEFAAGIPGTIGGAVVMNAGAYDGEMKQVVKSVTVLDKEGNISELNNNTMEFNYRTSVVKNSSYVILQVVLELQVGNQDQIKQKMSQLNEQRREKQPLDFPSAGSTFKRPEGHFAGKLIMDAGLRGYRIGDAQVSEKHCGFIVNNGKATASDVKDLMEEVMNRVYEMFGVRLESEVVFFR